ncbi:LPS export ABC transporter permease LptG [Marinobacterium arenosum]|uniref:LPS export ABC transporter permease LptG n=1 Tax=Marinobacterium arenosum TaxID=2862496 RepID=UPI001C9883A3|nr:LPS export ABC transporter permease LptG [Marinobacterium arenosum]MBY4678985.1 LPS export ABC transporter permease LptG [Marinobacterium arenosum]
MKLLDRYLAKYVMGATAAVLLVIVGLDLLFSLVDQLPDLSEQYDLLAAMQYVLLTLPRRLYEFIPLSALIGCLLGLGALASHSELTVMRSSGVSVQRIVTGVMKPVLILVLLALALGEFVVPEAEQSAQSFRSLRVAGGRALSAGGVWHRDGNHFIHINSASSKGVIHGVTRYEFGDDNQLLRASFAREGRYRPDGWLLQEVQETLFEDGQQLRSGTLAEERWQVELTPKLLSVVVVEPGNLSMQGLWQYTDYLERQGLSADSYKLAFWSKALQPVAILALVLVAVSFIFGPLRSVTVGQRLVAGIVVGLGFKFSQDMLGPASTVFGFHPLLAMLLPVVICALAGVILLRRAG